MPLSARYPSLQGRCVFISGGATGIGATLVQAFAAQGARVAYCDINGAAANALTAHLRPQAEAAGGALWHAHCDVTDTTALRATLQAAADALGPVRVLLNNAANDQRHTVADTTPEAWDQCMAVNLTHQFFAAQAVAPGMAAAGGGSIVNFGSISWKIKQGGMPAYTTAKAAVQGLTRSLARDFGPMKIRVNTLLPGWVMTEKQLRLWVTPDSHAEIARNQCLAQPLQAEDIAAMALFLSADDSAMCTAQDFIVDGGWV